MSIRDYMTTETTEDAVERHCTHRCAHYPTTLINPGTCERRLRLAKRKPVLIGLLPGWECLNCSGPIPRDTELPTTKPALPVHVGHEVRVLKQKAFKCCKCGTDDPSRFSPVHSKKCDACLEEYRELKRIRRNELQKAKSKPRTACVSCGKLINKGNRANVHRIKMKLCGECYGRLHVSRTVTDEHGCPVVMVRGR